MKNALVAVTCVGAWLGSWVFAYTPPSPATNLQTNGHLLTVTCTSHVVVLNSAMEPAFPPLALAGVTGAGMGALLPGPNQPVVVAQGPALSLWQYSGYAGAWIKQSPSNPWPGPVAGWVLPELDQSSVRLVVAAPDGVVWNYLNDPFARTGGSGACGYRWYCPWTPNLAVYGWGDLSDAALTDCVGVWYGRAYWPADLPGTGPGEPGREDLVLLAKDGRLAVFGRVDRSALVPGPVIDTGIPLGKLATDGPQVYVGRGDGVIFAVDGPGNSLAQVATVGSPIRDVEKFGSGFAVITVGGEVLLVGSGSPTPVPAQAIK